MNKTVRFISTVSIANVVACKSLDWLETAFPVLHAPTEQVTVYFPLSDLNEPHKMAPVSWCSIRSHHHLVCFTQVVATAKNKMHEIQDVVSIVANGTVDCVQHTVTWLMGKMQQVDEEAGPPLVERAIITASVGLESALIMSEALMNHMLPPTEEERGT